MSKKGYSKKNATKNINKTSEKKCKITRKKWTDAEDATKFFLV